MVYEDYEERDKIRKSIKSLSEKEIDEIFDTPIGFLKEEIESIDVLAQIQRGKLSQESQERRSALQIVFNFRKRYERLPALPSLLGWGDTLAESNTLEQINLNKIDATEVIKNNGALSNNPIINFILILACIVGVIIMIVTAAVNWISFLVSTFGIIITLGIIAFIYMHLKHK